MDFFVDKHSIVRKIWGASDTVLFIFAGAAAEFALNKAVDWLYFTGRLPADPIGRLFSTVSYARSIVFSETDKANSVIDKIHSIHDAVEESRSAKIPDWAYRDVLFMLIDYSIRSYELLERKLTLTEKEEVFSIFLRVGNRMQIKGLPASYSAWLPMREQHLNKDMVCSAYTTDLFRQYKKHLGTLRFFILKQAQILVAPPQVNKLLGHGKISVLKPVIFLYKIFRAINMDWFVKNLVLPTEYKAQIKALDIAD
ncbi:MAG TPA: oxygenase MpaB family protein [Parafilimonas sp.]|nr:oxygenase MpaB family protein [Parafilimonas sp.]